MSTVRRSAAADPLDPAEVFAAEGESRSEKATLGAATCCWGGDIGMSSEVEVAEEAADEGLAAVPGRRLSRLGRYREGLWTPAVVLERRELRRTPVVAASAAGV